MANYNSKRIYNKSAIDKGANYNSAPFMLLIVDNGLGIDNIVSVINNLDILDNILTSESITSIASVNVSDNSISVNDEINVTNNIDVSDTMEIEDNIFVIGNINITENGYGLDFMSLATTYFFINSDNVLNPLGVFVQGDSRYELLPSTRDNTEEIPGMHGEYDFGSEFKAKLLELSVITKKGLSSLEKYQLQRTFSKYLDPTKGVKKLVFNDDINKLYYVKYSGRIQPDFYATWFKFTIPFKMYDPFIYGTFEKSLTGNGKIKNEGTYKTGLIIEISGAITNPSVTIGTDILSYTGTIESGNTLVIDTLKKTAKIGNANAIDKFNGVFPLLSANTELNVVAGSNVKIKWRDKWL